MSGPAPWARAPLLSLAIVSFVAVVVVAVVGCADVDTPSPNERRGAPLTGGLPDPGDPAVVGLLFGDHVACTGVLVSTRVVLTAAHCLATHSALPRVLFGSDGSAPYAVIEVGEAFVPDAFSPLSLAHDIAALRLGQDAPAGVSPLARVSTSFVAGVQGATVRLVGFGHDSDVAAADAPHVKRQGTATIAAVGADTISLAPAPSQACVGDSGGPVLAEVPGGEGLIGLVLGGITSCTETAMALRIDTYADSFINPVIAGAASTGDPGPPIPDGGCSLVSQRSGPPSFILVGLLGALLLGSRRGG